MFKSYHSLYYLFVVWDIIKSFLVGLLAGSVFLAVSAVITIVIVFLFSLIFSSGNIGLTAKYVLEITAALAILVVTYQLGRAIRHVRR